MSASFQLCTIDGLPCVLRGPETGPAILIIQPLFEEMNRTRRLLAQVGAYLGAAGIRSWMPDLPGTGDADGRMDWESWQRAVLNLHGRILAEVDGNVGIVSVRGGALLTNIFPNRYLISPVTHGAVILRDLLRTRAAANPDDPAERSEILGVRLQNETLELAGYPITPDLAAALTIAETNPAGARVVVVGDSGIAGPLVWRQAEPLDASVMAKALASDIISWITACPDR